jgi:hypothetical protein
MSLNIRKLLSLVFLGLVLGACASTGSDRKTASQDENHLPRGDAKRDF